MAQGTETWQCKLCEATAEINRGPPLIYNTKYPAATGPYAEKRLLHDCPVKGGLLSEQMEVHPNAVRA